MSQFVQLFTKPAAKKKVERIAKLDRRTLSETVNVIADEALARRLGQDEIELAGDSRPAKQGRKAS